MAKAQNLNVPQKKKERLKLRLFVFLTNPYLGNSCGYTTIPTKYRKMKQVQLSYASGAGPPQNNSKPPKPFTRCLVKKGQFLELKSIGRFN